jgi:hypothetical protein
MPPNDKKRTDYDNAEHTKLTSGDLQNILEVNKKAIEIHLEVEKQNEDIIEDLSYIRGKVDEIDKALFKLIIVLSSIGVGTVIGIIQLFLGHK